MMIKSFAKIKAHHYLILIFILLLVVLAFYLSCRSKSPTEADSRLKNQVAAQSTNNTTTSSSTTTSVRPGQSPTNTTTLITSRNLTTTSIRTTTSSSSTTTTSRKPKPSTSSTTTTSIPVPILEWCSFYVSRISPGSPVVVSQQDQVVSLALRDQGIVICQFEMKNIGTAATTNLTISINQIAGNTSHLYIHSSWAVFSSINQIPNTRDCTLATAWPCIVILLSGATSGEEFTITLIEHVTQKTFSFKLHVT